MIIEVTNINIFYIIGQKYWLKTQDFWVEIFKYFFSLATSYEINLKKISTPNFGVQEAQAPPDPRCKMIIMI
jgi:hypothetical protein